MNGEEAPKKKKTWLWVLLGVFIFFVMLFIGGAVVAVSLFRQSVEITDNVSKTSATAEFDAVYAKYPGQQPLIQMVDGKPQVTKRDEAPRSEKQLTTLHLLAFDDDQEHLARIAVPFWLLRLKSGPFRLSAYQQGWEDGGVYLRVEDIEKHGPGIVVDASRGDGRMLVWAE